MRKLVLVSAALLAVAAPATASYANSGHGGGGGGGATKPVLSMADNASGEGEYTGSVTVTVNVTKASKKPVTVNVLSYDTLSAASARLVNGFGLFTVTIPANTLQGTTTLQVVDDNVPQPTETFGVQLQTPPRGYVNSNTNSTATETITDDDHGAFTLNAGDSVTVDSISYGGCDDLSGIVIGDLSGDLGRNNTGNICPTDPSPVPGTTYNYTNDTGSAQSFLLQFNDGYCGTAYISDGTSVGEDVSTNHASVQSTGPGTWTVLMNDCGAGARLNMDAPPVAGGGYNFTANITITPAP